MELTAIKPCSCRILGYHNNHSATELKKCLDAKIMAISAALNRQTNALLGKKKKKTEEMKGSL